MIFYFNILGTDIVQSLQMTNDKQKKIGRFPVTVLQILALGVN